MRSESGSATLQSTDMKTLRITHLLPLFALALVVCSPRAHAAVQKEKAKPERPQILWQRSLDDALAQSGAEGRPLFIAINYDGESASDRIVKERYADPDFVRMTRSFVCVVASVARHNPRDYDDHGRRIPCPRLGEVTCGEHIALEPLLFDRYLGGSRISPRHALIQADKTKSFDLFEQWDWDELDARMREYSALAPEVVPPHVWTNPLEAKKSKDRQAQLRALAGARQARARAAFESWVSTARSDRGFGEALAAIAEVGDLGSLGVLHVMLCREPSPSEALVEDVGNVTATLKIGPQLSAIVRQRLLAPGAFPGAPGLDDDRKLLPILARFDSKTPATRSFLLANFAIGSERDRRAAGAAVAPSLTADEVVRTAGAIEKEGGGTELSELLVFARDVGRALPRVVKPAKPAQTLEELEVELDKADRRLRAEPDDESAQKAFGLSSLEVGSKYVEAGGGNPTLHLEDADTWLARAASAHPHDAQLGFARARVAYLRGKFADEERIARESFNGFPARDAIAPAAMGLADFEKLGDGDVRRAATLLFDEERLEALRWVGDAAARMIGARAGHDAAAEAAGYTRGSRALALVAAAPSSDEVDWVSLASFLSAIGDERSSSAAWEAGVARFPESNALRDGLTRSLWNAGRVDLLPIKADWFASLSPNSGTCAWYAGLAWILQAEDLRRQHAYTAAVEAYTTSRARFLTSIELAPQFQATAMNYVARTELGAGFALFELGRRQLAADALASAMTCSPDVIEGRDGLDREAVDLVDSLLEWRDGHPSPLEPITFAEQLATALPSSTRMVLAVADSELREGLRADGRSPRGASGSASLLEHAPSAEGDVYLNTSITVGRRALKMVENDETKTRLAQSLAVHGERRLARDDFAAALPLVTEAATLLGETPPAPDADAAALKACAAKLRERLGPARPVFRPGR